ncbi:MAG: RHS repeat-associated core domain-containing protein [Pseudomonadota bacterium]
MHFSDGGLPTAIESRGAAQGRLDLSYDTLMLPSAMDLTSGSDSAHWGLAYDAALHVVGYGDWTIARDGPLGSASAMHDAAAELVLGRDEYGRLVHKSLSVGSVVRYQLDLTLDLLDRVVERIELLDGVTTTWSYAYDEFDHLVQVTRDSVVVETYTYDARGNRTSRAYDGASAETSSYDLRDRIAMVGGADYTLDDDGQLALRGSDSFVYGVRGELLEATVGSDSVDYGYDGAGRRVSRHDAAGDVQVLYGTPGAWWRPLAVRLADDTLQIYTYDDMSAALAMDRGATRYYLATDQVGTVRAVFDASGALVKRVDRDSFGRLLADSAPALDVVLGFGGGLEDTLTGLTRLGLRDYDPEAGRFTSTDLKLFNGGQYHLYAYAGSDPVGHADPTGLFCVGGSFFAVVGGGGELCVDEDGLSACAELGVGVGNGFDFDPFGDIRESNDFSVKAEGGLEIMGYGVDGEFRVSRCTGISSSGGIDVPGGIGYDIENRYNPNTGRWEGGEFETDSPMDAYQAGMDVVDMVKGALSGKGDLGYGASASATMEGCVRF